MTNQEFYPSYFRLTIILKTPNTNGKALDLKTKATEIIEAIKKFNSRFTIIKNLKLEFIAKSEITLLLQINNPVREVEEITLKELTYFSRVLKNDLEWKNLSRSESLFTLSKDIEKISKEVFEVAPAIPKEHDLDLLISDHDAIKLLESLINTKDIGPKDAIQIKNEKLKNIKNILYDTFKHA